MTARWKPIRWAAFAFAMFGALAALGCAAPPARSSRPRQAPSAKDQEKAGEKPSEARDKPSSPSRHEARDAPGLDKIRERIVASHNRIRTEAELNTLEVSQKLRATAQAHALDMARQGKMTHKGSNGSKLGDRVKDQKYRYRRVGENIAYATGKLSHEQLMKGWMDSPPHKKNILGGFSQIGVGCAIDEDGKRYWCVNFGLPSQQ